MRLKSRYAVAFAVVAGAGAGAAATAAWSDDPSPAADGGDVHQRIVRPALEPDPAARSVVRKAKRPKVTHLITSTPIAVAADDEIVAELICKKSQGTPLSGGAIAPPSPAQVAVHVLSRFNPNPPYEGKPQTYYVGVRNLGLEPQEFRATLTCAKGISG